MNARKLHISLALTLGLLAVAGLLTLMGAAGGGLPVVQAQGSNTHYVAPSGDCGEVSPCYSTIQAAVDAASNGDIIKVAQGQYTSVVSQVVHIDKAITLAGGYSVTNWDNSDPLNQPTVIDAEGADRRGVYIDGTGVMTITLMELTIQRASPLNSDGAGVFIQNGTVVLRQNLVMSNTTDINGTQGGGLYVACGTVFLFGNTFQGNGAAGGGGVSIIDGEIKGNRFISNAAFQGGGLSTSGGTVTMSKNVFLGNRGAPNKGPSILIGSGGTVDAENDIIADSGNDPAGGAVFVQEGGTLTTRHWTLANNGGYAIKTNGGSALLTNTLVVSHTLAGLAGAGIVADTTLFYNSGTPCVDGATCTNSLSGDPKFVNSVEGDYHISAGSAAIDTGVDVGVTDDIDGNLRPVGAGYDIGADEFGYLIYLPLVLRNN